MKCAHCGSIFERGDDIYKDEEGNLECEEHHFDNLGWTQCDNCMEYKPEEGFSDDDDGDGVCNSCRLNERTKNE